MHDELYLSKRDHATSGLIYDMARLQGYQYEHSTHSLSALLKMIATNPIYRIRVNKSLSVDTDCYDLLDNFAPELERHYTNVEDLPTWVQNKLAVLMILDASKKNEDISGVGRRISNEVFWVYKDGDDSGESCKGKS